MSVQESKELNSQYFTDQEECHLLLRMVDQIWGLPDGAKVLEPSVGSGNFIRAEKSIGFEIDWTTNELFPEANNFSADLQMDFMEMTAEDAGRPEFVIGNPPFSGTTTINGKHMSLGMAFICKALDLCDRVAYILPPNVLRTPWLAMLPEGVRVVAHTEPKTASYHLGGFGGGEIKQVKTTAVLFERTNDTHDDYKLLIDAIPGLEFVSSYDEATHAIQTWGGSAARALDGSWGRLLPWAGETPVRLTNIDTESILATTALSDYITKFTAASPTTGPQEIVHLLNTAIQSDHD